jgi:hypothetical protein
MLLPTVSRPVYLGAKPRLWLLWDSCCLLMWGALSEERTGMSFTTDPGSRQRSHSRVRVLRYPWPYFTVSDSRVPQYGGPAPRIYIPQEQGGSVIPSGTGFPLRRLLRLAGLRWRCSNQPPHRLCLHMPSVSFQKETLWVCPYIPR